MSAQLRNLSWVAIGVLTATVVVLLTIAIFTSAVSTEVLRSQSEAIRDSQRANGATLRAVKSCTTPGRSCFERGQRETAKAVGDINRVAVLAAACADRRDVQTVAEIEACVIAGLDKLGVSRRNGR